MKKPAPAGYLERSEYNARLPLVQNAIYESMAENDARFGGNDHIHAVFVYGSYGKSFFRKRNPTLVRRGSAFDRGSDLDILTVESNLNNRQLIDVNNTDLTLITDQESLDQLDGLRKPTSRLIYVLQRNLHNVDLNITAESYDEVDLDAPLEQEISFLSDESNRRIKYKAGLLFVPETEVRRDLIFGIFRASGLKVVVDPATTALVL